MQKLDRLAPAVRKLLRRPGRHRLRRGAVGLCIAGAVVLFSSVYLNAREKEAIQYGAGLIVNVPFPEAQVLQVVQDVAQNGVIRGTKEYSKDEYVSGATFASSTHAFPEWTEPGKVFYKIKLKALDPQNFKNTNDVGTLAVRYVVQGQDDKHTVLHIDARFVEDYRRMSHPSNGSVEGAEYGTIHDRLEAIEAMKNSTTEFEKEKQEAIAKRQTVLADETSSSVPASTTANSPATQPAPAASSPDVATPAEPPQTVEERVKDLRRQVERLVKAPGAPLKSAPFHSATTLQSLPAGSEVLIEIATPYWLGIETHDGQRGWVLRDDLELLP